MVKMHKKTCKSQIFAMVLILATLFFAVGIQVNQVQAAEPEVWNEIHDASQLISMDLTANYRLMADITLTGNWTPLGALTGQFDGNGKKIRNITITDTVNTQRGLFSAVGESGRITNLGIEGANITAGDTAGILAGTNQGVISRCYTAGTLSGRDAIGGLVGINTGTIENCYTRASVKGRENVGGLVGLNDTVNSKIIDCYAASEMDTPVFNNYLTFNSTTGTAIEHKGFIEIPHHSRYETEDFTLEAWFQWDKVGSDAVNFIIGKGFEEFEIHTGGGSLTNGIRFIPVKHENGDSWLDARDVIQPGWFHVASVYDYDDEADQATVQLNINGVAQDLYQNNVSTGVATKIGKTVTLTRTSNPLSANKEPISIGRRSNNSLFFEGKIADVRIWNVARDEGQIQANKDKVLIGNEEGLVGYWKLAESDGTTAIDSLIDSGGNPIGNNGTLHGDIIRKTEATAAYIGGLVGQNNGGTVTESFYDSELSNQSDTGKGLPTSTVDMKKAGTFTAWESNIWGVDTEKNNGYPYLKSTAKYITSFSFSSLDPQVSGAIDQESGTIALTVPYGTNVTSLTPSIQHTGVSVSPTSFQNFSSPVIYTITAEDNSTKDYTVTVNFPPAAGSGFALDFDGSDDFIGLPSSVRFGGNSDFTIAMWIYPDSESTSLLYRQQALPYQLGIWFSFVADTNGGHLRTGLDSNSYGGWQWTDGSTNIPINQWTHVAMVKSGDHLLTYINGVKDIDVPIGSYQLASILSTNTAAIGSTGFDGYFNGRIDEVQIWNTALSSSALSNWMFREVDSTHPNYDSLLAYYKLNEGTGTNNVSDAKGTNHGTMNNMAAANWVESGIKSWKTLEDSSLTGFLFGSDMDGSSTDGTNWSINFELVDQGTKGSAILTGANQFTYTPNANTTGNDTFTYLVRDGNGQVSSVQTISIAIDSVNDPPSFTKGQDQTVSKNLGVQTVTGWATAISEGPADESGQSVYFVVTNDNPSLFSVQPAIASNGSLTYTPAADAYGTATVSVRIQDDGGTANGGMDMSSAQTFTITISSNNYSFFDAFDGTKSSDWQIYNRDDAYWNLAEKSGSLRIYTTPTDTYSTSNNLINLFYLPLPVGLDDYQITGKISFPVQPYQNYHMGGVALLSANGGEPDYNNLIRMEYVYTGTRHFETQYEVGGIFTNTNSGSVNIASSSPYWVRIKKQGNILTTYYSTDGISYQQLFSQASPLNIAYAGLYALHTNIGMSPIAFDFDSFKVQLLSDAAAEDAANAAIATAKGLLPASFTATEGVHTNLLAYLNAIPGMNDAGVTLTLVSSNANIANNGTITYTGSEVIGNVVVQINKTNGTQDSKTITVTVPAHTPTAEELANAAIATAKGLLPASFTATEGVHTNLLAYLNAIPGINDAGVTLTLVSANANIANNGTITYTGSEVIGDVVLQINKTSGTQDTKTIAVTVPVHSPTAEELANAAIATAKGLLPASFTATEGVHANLVSYLNAIPGMGDAGVTLTLVSSNANIANNGTITYTGSEVIGNVVVQINKTSGTQDTKTIAVTVPVHSPTAEELANAAIATAKGLLPASFTATEGVHTNLLAYLNAIPGMSDTGVTLSLVSSNANIANNGTITYTGSEVIGNVVVQVNKTSGTQDTKTIAVTVPVHSPTAEELANAAIATAKGLLPASFTATEGVHTNLLAYLNAIPGMSDTGVTLSLVSSNANIANNGTITYTGSEVIGNVVVQVNKTSGTQDTKTIAVTVPAHISSGGSGNGDSSNSSSTNQGTQNTGGLLQVNGQAEPAATVTISLINDQQVSTVLVDDEKLKNRLQTEGMNPLITIPVKNGSDVVVGILNGQTVKSMELKEAVLEIQTPLASYTLPAAQINIDAISSQLGKQVSLEDIKVEIKIAETGFDTTKIVEDAAKRGNYQLVVKPVDFEITCTSGDKTVEISQFKTYVERMVAVPDGIDPGKITTGVVLNRDGTFSHVPTSIVIINGKYFAKINSLTNSTYSVIWNQVAFRDLLNHWAKDDINDMGSRLIVQGDKNNNFNPDNKVTRADFAASIIRALGLMHSGTGKDIFKDVLKGNEYYDVIGIAFERHIIYGYSNGLYGVQDYISREQALTIIARVMKITGLYENLKPYDTNEILAAYKDADLLAAYAREGVAACIVAEIALDKGENILAPKEAITKAEMAVLIRRLLQMSKLI